MNEQQTIWAAFAAAQADFKPIVKNRVNPAFHSKYADLQSILSATMPALTAHGLAVTQKVEMSGSTVKVETILYAANGDCISSGVLEMTVPAGKNAVQAAGSTLTYARRYSLAAFLSVAADDDDDGNAAGAQEKLAYTLTQEAVDDAKAAAAGGVAAYKAYYQARPQDEREALSKSGWHAWCYKAAQAADSAKEGGAE